MADDDASDSGSPGKQTANEEKKHTKQQRIIIGVAIAGVIATLLILRRSSSSATANPTNTATSAYPYSSGYGIDPSTGIPYVDEMTGNTSGVAGSGLSTSDWNQLNTDFAGVQTEITALQSQMSANGSAPTTGSATSVSQSAYAPLSSAMAAQDLLAAGQSVYYSPVGAAPGTMLPVSDPFGATGPWLTGTNPGGPPGSAPMLPPNTALFQKTP